MTKKRYYSKGAPTEEPKAPVSCESSGIGMRANVVLPEVSPKYVKKDKEELPLTFVVVFSGGTEREKDYLSPILNHKSDFPKLKLEFLADDTFYKGGKPKIFDFSLFKQAYYKSSAECDTPDRYFLLTDVDEFGKWVSEEIPICEHKGISVIVSNPCFEVWLYYATRQDKFSGFVVPKDASKLSKEVKKWCGRVIKGGLQPKRYLYCLKDNIENAKKTFKFNKITGYGDLFSTNAFELGQVILPIIEPELKRLEQEQAKKRSAFKKASSTVSLKYPPKSFTM